MADKLEQVEICAGCTYMSNDVGAASGPSTNEDCWTFLVMNLVNMHDDSKHINNYHIRVIVCPKCKTMRML